MNIKLSVAMLARQLDVELADLSQVADPVGRIDFLASKFLEQTARALPPELQMTYHAARPLVDGLIVKHLGGVSVRVPDEVRQLFVVAARNAQQKEAA